MKMKTQTIKLLLMDKLPEMDSGEIANILDLCNSEIHRRRKELI